MGQEPGLGDTLKIARPDPENRVCRGQFEAHDQKLTPGSGGTFIQRINAGIENAFQPSSVMRWNQNRQKQKRQYRRADYDMFPLALDAELPKRSQDCYHRSDKATA